MRKQMLVKIIVMVFCVAVVGYAIFLVRDGRGTISYNEHLEDTVVTIDGTNVTFKELAFYILYEERKVEEQARIYNSESTKDYWNMHTDEKFVETEAKDAVLGMAIHDHLFYQMALEEGMDTLTPEEESDLQFAITDFWEDLLDEQWEKLPCTQEEINDQIRLAAIAEKYQDYLAKTKGPSQAAYKYDGYYYKLIKEEHSVKINKKLWESLVLGDITLEHTTVNFINGLNHENKKEKEE